VRPSRGRGRPGGAGADASRYPAHGHRYAGDAGLDLVDRAKRIHPDMTAIVMTGFVEEFSYEESIRAGAADFIKKPFTVHELLVRIQARETAGPPAGARDHR